MLDQKGSNVFKLGLNWIKLVQNRPKGIKSWVYISGSKEVIRDQTGSKVRPNWIKRDQTRSNRIKLDQIESNRIKQNQIESKKIKLDQN